jgi:hypothetical protein
MLLLATPMNTFPSTMETKNIVKNTAIKINRRGMITEGVLVLAVVKVPVGYVLHSFWVMYHN